MRMRQTIGLSLVLLVVTATAMAKQAQSAHHQPVHSIKAKHVRAIPAAVRSGAKRHRTSHKAVARAEHRRLRHIVRSEQQQEAQLPPQDRYIGPLRAVGRPEIGRAAWYGGWHIGRRTASGERLDAIHATAAHRSLPLNSLVRVTNLSNGRSAIATINDRGPVSRSLLIDVSPRVAQELDMMHAGLAMVSVEPVVPAARPSR